jgi:hypothetical protein
MRSLFLALAAAAAMLAAGCGMTQIEEAQEEFSESPEEKLEREGRELAESSGPKRSEDWVVGTIVEVTRDFKVLTLSFPVGSEVSKGDVFLIYRDYKPLPASRHPNTHYRQLYLGRAEVTTVARTGCEARILHRVTENPIKPGDTAITKIY